MPQLVLACSRFASLCTTIEATKCERVSVEFIFLYVLLALEGYRAYFKSIGHQIYFGEVYDETKEIENAYKSSLIAE